MLARAEHMRRESCRVLNAFRAADARLREGLAKMLDQCGCSCCAGPDWGEAKVAARAALAKAKEGT